MKGEDPLLDRAVYQNQCAINMHAALERSGTSLKSFRGLLSWQKDKPKYAIRARELADWLASPFSMMPKVQKFSGMEVFERTKGKRGIIYFQNYWGPGNQGDHIDLWNGSRLTDWRSWIRIQMNMSIPGIWEDLKKSESVWFWSIP